MGIDKSRVLIKLASILEGIRAASILQREHGINCNLTLMFSMVQAIAAAEAGAYLISPFVGSHLGLAQKPNAKELRYSEEGDPGVASVRDIFNYYKRFGYGTIVIGASSRNTGEITELAGCDYLTNAPALLEELSNCHDKVSAKLNAKFAADAKLLRDLLAPRLAN